jgi:hypothetical protein
MISVMIGITVEVGVRWVRIGNKGLKKVSKVED